jgi:hypothetical protein
VKQKGEAKNVMPTNDKPEGDSKFRIALAKTVTTWALVAILAIAALIIVVAGINAIRFPKRNKGINSLTSPSTYSACFCR